MCDPVRLLIILLKTTVLSFSEIALLFILTLLQLFNFIIFLRLRKVFGSGSKLLTLKFKLDKIIECKPILAPISIALTYFHLLAL